MSIDFWNDGASIVIYAAFEPEVAPLIARCKLRRKAMTGQVTVYQHDECDLKVVINGEAGASILLPTGMSLVSAQPHTRHLLIGTSGHASLPVGTWYHPSHLQLEGTHHMRRLYPSLDGAQDFVSSIHTTRSHFEPNYLTEGGIDLETYHWFHGLSRQVHLDALGIVRLVTDTPDHPMPAKANFKLLAEQITQAWSNAQKEIDHWLGFHAKRSAQGLSRKRVEEMPAFLERFKWSQNQSLQLMRLVERAALLDFDLEAFVAQTFDERVSRRDVLKKIAVEIDSIQVKLDG